MVYIRFSRCFQRHVVFKCQNGHGCSNGHSRSHSHSHSHSHRDCDNGEIMGSFIFLDDAIQSFPSAEVVKLKDDDEGGMGVGVGVGIRISKMPLVLSSTTTSDTSTDTDTDTDTNHDTDTDHDHDALVHKSLNYLTSLAFTGQRKSLAALPQLMQTIPPQRLASHTPETIHRNYDRVMDLLTRGRDRSSSHHHHHQPRPEAEAGHELEKKSLLSITKVGLAFDESDARAVIAEFPQICLYDIHELEDRIKFMISPCTTTSTIIDKTPSPNFYNILRKGYGAGLSIEQATKAIGAVPQFLSLHYEDSRKPSMIYFYKSLHIPPISINEARTELRQYCLGCDASDVCSFAYLHSLGVSWDQIRMLLEAFPTLTYSERDPSWDLLDRSMRSELGEEMLHYLRKRLQISNADVHSMLKVHSRLSSYRVENIASTLDALQFRLNLSSSELNRVVLRMPSIIGIHVNNTVTTSSLDRKINFFLKEVQLSPHQLKTAVLKQPSLLQYSLESLRSKCDFLVEELAIPESSLARIISASPVTLGLSLDQNLRPTVATLKGRCNLSSRELGEIVITCPTILALSQKRKIEPCLTFLSTNLLISSNTELGNVIKRAPRILQQGIDTSLARKITMLKEALQTQTKVRKGKIDKQLILIESAQILKDNPALLTTTNLILQNRIKKCEIEPRKDIATTFTKRGVGRKRMFELTEHSKFQAGDDIPTRFPPPRRIQSKAIYNTSMNTLSLYAFVSGSIYPPDDINQVRGQRKAGGLAIFFPQMLGRDNDFDFDSAMNMSFGMPMPQNEGGSKPQNGLILVGFPFLRPSRNRCDMYACHGALKVVLQLLKQAATKQNMKGTKVDVKIYTDSSYAWKLLKNSTQLEKWGSLASEEDFVYDGDGPATMVNRDLLFPLTKTMHRLVTNEVTNRHGDKVVVGDVRINFFHSGDYYDSHNYMHALNLKAKTVAKWQFNKG
mmetsp:Transcript_20331/g.30530  ORF Transcript_20331/g.30530 Transcript_20331/m.30530 type:complete len:959 (-) Transcript_20331:657-3533(-)